MGTSTILYLFFPSLVVTSASLLVTSALLVATMFAIRNKKLSGLRPLLLCVAFFPSTVAANSLRSHGGSQVRSTMPESRSVIQTFLFSVFLSRCCWLVVAAHTCVHNTSYIRRAHHSLTPSLPPLCCRKLISLPDKAVL